MKENFKAFEERPIINCHAHIFTADHVPPYLAKTFLPWPFYYLLPVNLVVGLFRFWYKYPNTWQFKPWYRNIGRAIYAVNASIRRSVILRVLNTLFQILALIHVFFILYDAISFATPAPDSIAGTINSIRQWLLAHNLLFEIESVLIKFLLVLLVMLFYENGRNIIWFIFKKIWSFLGILPGPKSRELVKRYLNIGRFSFYQQQSGIFSKLKNQYPSGTAFIILPMDMEFMDAGDLKHAHQYHQQMAALADIKSKKENSEIFYPFVFADPRRIKAEGQAHFKYSVKDGQVILHDCFVKNFIVDQQFSGFKIYPALGYYPFDESLLPLWKYAADQGLPILSHCIRGTIFYRGTKKPEWDTHPVFEQACGEGLYEPLFLGEIDNSDYINNFTHPLNFLCLLEEQLLRKLVGKAKDNTVRELFGYTDSQTPMRHNLSHLKICLGHFGGDDEWEKFMDSDRDNYSSQLVRYPDKGISFLTSRSGDPAPGKPEQIWRFTDWYSIICSLMLQYEHVYADLSYIIHNNAIQPLLKHTLRNPSLRQKVLFGTDFYVVRNHKSEKQMLADLFDDLSEAEIEAIAKINPRNFLGSILHGPVLI